MNSDLIKPIPGIQYASLVLTGHIPFPTNKQESVDRGFKAVLDKEMEEIKNGRRNES